MMLLFAVFAKAVGNFGSDVGGRSLVPQKAIAKFSGTGNYVFRTLQDAEDFRTTQRGYCAVMPLDELGRIVEESKSQKRKLLESGWVQDTEFRLRKGDDFHTLGVVFHERPPTEAESKANRDVQVIESEPAFSIVLKRENMLGEKLDPTNRIPWGAASGILSCESTARSMSTVSGLLQRVV
jgi:hypothetical protein